MCTLPTPVAPVAPVAPQMSGEPVFVNEQVSLRVRMGLTGRELEGVTVWRCDASPSEVRASIGQVLGIEPIGLKLTVDGEVWADGSPVPRSVLDGEAVLEVVRVPPTAGELHRTVVWKIQMMSHNAASPQYCDIYLRNFDRPHFGVFADLHDAFPVIGYIGMARIFMLRTRVHQYLELSAPVRLTDRDVWKELVDDDDIWTWLRRVHRDKARTYLWDLHTGGEIDLGELAARWAVCQYPDGTR